MSGRPSHRLAQPLQHIALHLIAIRAVELDGANVHRVCVDGPLRGPNCDRRRSVRVRPEPVVLLAR